MSSRICTFMIHNKYQEKYVKSQSTPIHTTERKPGGGRVGGKVEGKARAEGTGCCH